MTHPLQLRMGIEIPHRNRYLFSDHYLESILPNDPRWDQALSEAQAFCDWLRQRYADERGQLDDYNEDQLRDHWFTPILRELGHAFEREASVPGLETYAKRPDYVFFPDDAARQRAASLQNQEDYAAEALTVGEVKRWDTPLGKKRKGGGPSFEDRNPSWQIDYYVRITGLDWAILSNGRLWRLVHHDTSQRLNIYYEVDLVDLLQRDDPGLMRYFTLFFRQAAFQPDAQGRRFLDDVLAESNAYAVALEEDVEENVYRALEYLMQGFLDLPQNGLGPEDLPAIYDNSLYLLYRLLFILYGESRGLLPMDKEQYREHYSLESIKLAIAAGHVPPAPMTTVMWVRLYNLFRIIGGHTAELNRSLEVPRYDGGLFNPELHPFLEQNEVGDQALVRALDLLSRRETKAGREFVDYRTLDVRHLGSIYEGLLEYQPRVAQEPMVAVGDEWLAADEAPEGARVLDRREPGQVYLETDRGERKATGSYYTPQYIVEYIVEHTLGPLVDEVTARAQSSARENGANGGDLLVDEILDLKVLDPAMGSGHFLVEATEFLARALATDPQVETGQVAEEDLTYWKRRVVERCIYGVDKNPLAVELAKLSLWLATVSADRPLSFLDHHLKCGDSLIGARVRDLGDVPPVMLSKKALKEREERYEAGARQANLFEMHLTAKLPVVMGRILEITEQESADFDTVQAKEAADRAVRELKAPFEAVAHLWTSAYFGNEFIKGDYDQALMNIGQPEALMALPAVQRAREMADERRFFHWELAFPEVFYDEQGRQRENAGFDVVVGNPPYGLIESLPWFAELHNDAFVYFWKLGVNQSCTGGYLSLITPAAWLTGPNYQSLRQLLLEKTKIERIVRLPYDVFPDAYIDTCVAVVEVGRASSQSVQVKQMGKRSDPTEVKELAYEIVDPSSWHDDHLKRFVLDPTVVELQRFRYLPDFIRLGEIIEVERGVQPYSRSKHTEEQIRDDFLRLHHAPPAQQKDIYYPELLGEELSRYCISPARRIWLKYSDELAGKRDERFFTTPRVVLRRLLSRSRELMAAITSERLITTDNILNILIRDERYSEGYIASLLNSSLVAWIYTGTSAISVKDDFPQVTYEELKSLPIRRIEFTTPADEREALVEEGRVQAERAVQALAASHLVGSGTPMGQAALDRAAAPALSFVEERLSVEPEQADVVHDLLAHLAQRIIAMHQERQERIEAFWLDLEGVTDADTFEKLSEHGKWESSLWQKKPCRPFVDQESHSTRHLDESLAWNEDCFKAFVKLLGGRVQNLSKIVAVYRQHHPEFRALVRRIAATDRLIDHIVYRLYRLTEDEIAVVEGRPVR